MWDTLASELQAYFGNLDLRPIEGRHLLAELHAIPRAFSLLFHRANDALKFKLSRRATTIIHDWDKDTFESLTPRSASKTSGRRKLSVSRNATLLYIGQGAAASQSESWFMDGFSLVDFLLQDFEFGIRSKVNDIAALCTGLDFSARSEKNGEESDRSHFRKLARAQLTTAVNSNPTNPLATGGLAKILFLDTLERFDVSKMESRMCLANHWFTADIRYCEFLWTSAIANSGKKTWILSENMRMFARFLLTGPPHIERAAFMLASSIFHSPEGKRNSDDVELLKCLLSEMGMHQAANLLSHA
jgi:hypothetical protein